ncbi:MAG: diacylglycerol kinase family lipid kinase, partial [Oscillospiraceae bacterium]|nr:diacylglycerol kinase family lipid kinase [Oscillospiraceae bacterium]
MRYIFVVNPAAGKDKKALSLIPEIQKACEKTGAECEIYISKSGEGITDYVGKCCEKGEEIRFYAIGGDG